MDTSQLLGRIVDRRYRINELIGSGGMGSVYRATHLEMNREIALKVLGRGIADSHKQKSRFRIIIYSIFVPSAILCFVAQATKIDTTSFEKLL